MKPKILFILHLPPPIHGAAMMGKYIQESELVNSSFDCFCINLATNPHFFLIFPCATLVDMLKTLATSILQLNANFNSL